MPEGMEIPGNGPGDPTPLFLVMSKKNGDNFDVIGPFKLAKAMGELVGQVNACRKIKDGLLIHTINPTQSRKLLSTTTFLGFDVTVSPHRTRNTCRGVINHRDIKLCADDELIAGLAEYGVCAIRRLKRRNNEGTLVDTASAVLTFQRSRIPSEVKMGYEIVPVRPYVPAPMRCFHCQKFGHSATRCEKKDQPAICICGQARHDGVCSSTPVCPNCQDSHLATSKSCSVLRREETVEQLRARENLSYPEARRRLAAMTPRSNVSYSNATQSKSNPTPSANPQISDIVAALIPVLRTMMTDIVRELLPMVCPPLVNTIEENRPSVATVVSHAPNVVSHAPNVVSEAAKRQLSPPTPSSEVFSSGLLPPAATTSHVLKAPRLKIQKQQNVKNDFSSTYTVQSMEQDPESELDPPPWPGKPQTML